MHNAAILLPPSGSDHRQPIAEPRLWFGYLVNQIGHRIRTETAAAIAPTGVSLPILRLLGIIAVDQPLTQTQLGARSGMDRTSIVKFVDRMSALGLAERQVDPQDRRSHAILLTESGRIALQQASLLADAAEALILAPLAPDARQALIQLLATVHQTHASICPDKEEETA